MSDPGGREPHEVNPSPIAPLEPPDPAAHGGADELRGDLAAVPAFLRSRARASTSGPLPHVPALTVPPARSEPADIASLPMLSIAPRRLILIGATIVLAWMLVSFGRQVAEASASSSRAQELRAANAALAAEVAAMEEELRVIQDQRYISQAARAFRLGNPGEIPFALAAGAPPLGPDAPGSAAVGLGADGASRSPLESWLDVLFGPGG